MTLVCGWGRFGGLVAAVSADGGYDGDLVYEAVAACHPDADVIIPPRSTAIPTETAASQRDRIHPAKTAA